MVTAYPELQKRDPVPRALRWRVDVGLVEWRLSEEERRQREATEVAERLRKEEAHVYQEEEAFREQRLRRVLKRVERVPVAQLAKLLRFRDADALVEWLVDLPEDTPLRLDGDYVVVRTGTSAAEIDRLVALIQKVEESPEARRTKKAEGS